MEGGRNEAAEKKLTLSGLRRRYSSTEPCYEKCVVEVVADSCGCKLEKADPTQGGKESELPNCDDNWNTFRGVPKRQSCQRDAAGSPAQESLENWVVQCHALVTSAHIASIVSSVGVDVFSTVIVHAQSAQSVAARDEPTVPR